MHTPARLLATATARSRGWLATAVLASIVAAAAALASPALLADAVNATLHGEPTGMAVARLSLAITVGMAAMVLRGYAAAAAGATAVTWLRRGMLHRLLAAGPAGVVDLPPGDLVSRFTSSSAQASRTGLTVLDAAIATATAISGIAALWLIDLRLAVTFLLGLPLALVIVRLFLRQGSPIFGRYQELQATIAARLVEAMGGARTIRASGTLDRETARVLAPLPDLADAGRRSWALQRSAAVQIGLLLPLIEVATLAVGGLGVEAGRITPGDLVAAVGYVGIAIGLFDQIDTLLSLGVATTAAGRVLQVLRIPLPATGDRDLPPGGGGRRVTWRGVTVRVEGRTVLDAVDLDIPAGACVAVVGRSGTGKTSLAALVGRLREPDDGSVLIDGVPVTGVSGAALRRAVSYAFERPAPLGDTIADTIALARPDAAEQAIRAAAAAAQADQFIDRLPGGYRTPLTGTPLSGGEAQRLGLARALLHAGDVVILDDATSSLDTVTESQVSRAITGLLADRTRIIVAHRASTAARADTVVWLDEGRVRARAPHADLWADPQYRALFGATPDEEEPQWT